MIIAFPDELHSNDVRRRQNDEFVNYKVQVTLVITISKCHFPSVIETGGANNGKEKKMKFPGEVSNEHFKLGSNLLSQTGSIITRNTCTQMFLIESNNISYL
jgi:hypothetical protein